MDRFKNVCRACNTERPNLEDLSTAGLGVNTLTWREILFTVCPSLPIRDDTKLPQKICNVCTKRLEIAYAFQLQCLQSDQELWNSLEETIVKTEPVQNTFVAKADQTQVTTVYVGEGCMQLEEPSTDDISQADQCRVTFLNTTNQFAFVDDTKVLENTTEIGEHLTSPLPMVEHPPSQTEAPFFCCYCDKKYFTANGLRFHEKLSHKNLKPILVKAEILTIECKFCRQVFEKKNELLLHCRTEHKDELMSELICNVCHKSFSCKNRLEHHLLYHSKSKFQCPVKDCKRVFGIKYKLTDHMKRFHGITWNSIDRKSHMETDLKDMSTMQ